VLDARRQAVAVDAAPAGPRWGSPPRSPNARDANSAQPRGSPHEFAGQSACTKWARKWNVVVADAASIGQRRFDSWSRWVYPSALRRSSSNPRSAPAHSDAAVGLSGIQPRTRSPSVYPSPPARAQGPRLRCSCRCWQHRLRALVAKRLEESSKNEKGATAQRQFTAPLKFAALRKSLPFVLVVR
jgi:hypothetical protein